MQLLQNLMYLRYLCLRFLSKSRSLFIRLGAGGAKGRKLSLLLSSPPTFSSKASLRLPSSYQMSLLRLMLAACTLKETFDMYHRLFSKHDDVDLLLNLSVQ